MNPAHWDSPVIARMPGIAMIVLGLLLFASAALAGEEEEEGGRTTTVNRRFFVYRVGLLYEFEIGKLLVTPQVHYDYSSGADAVVYARAFGFKF